jgi:hypothetical protein
MRTILLATLLVSACGNRPAVPPVAVKLAWKKVPSFGVQLEAPRPPPSRRCR